MSQQHLALALPLLMLLAGCSETASEDVKTSGMWVDFSVSAADDSTIDASAAFRSGTALSNTVIELSGSDYVDATHDTTTQLMDKVSILAIPHYETTFSNLAQTSNELVAITLHRADELPTITNIRLPDTFGIGAPPANTLYHIGNNDTINVSWAPAGSGDVMTVTYLYSCSAGARLFSGSITHEKQGDPGIDSATVNQVLASLVSDPAIDTSALSCNVRVTVNRSRSQSVADAYNGGTAKGIQSRDVRVNFAP